MTLQRKQTLYTVQLRLEIFKVSSYTQKLLLFLNNLLQQASQLSMFPFHKATDNCWNR